VSTIGTGSKDDPPNTERVSTSSLNRREIRIEQQPLRTENKVIVKEEVVG
jgi:hypothetical protein